MEGAHESLNKNNLQSSPVTLTIRVIRSFKFKNWRPLILRKCDLTMSWRDLKSFVDEALTNSDLPVPFKRDVKFYDSFKLETNPTTNSSKSSNALINTATQLVKLDESSSLSSLESHSVRNEYEISLFNFADYEEYVKSLDNFK